MLPKPPSCPFCPDHRSLWRDTTYTGDGPEFWGWYCTGCRHFWKPTDVQRRELQESR